MRTKSILTENKHFEKFLRRNFVVSFHYLSDLFFVERETTIPINIETIRHNICNAELQPNIFDI